MIVRLVWFSQAVVENSVSKTDSHLTHDCVPGSCPHSRMFPRHDSDRGGRDLMDRDDYLRRRDRPTRGTNSRSVPGGFQVIRQHFEPLRAWCSLLASGMARESDFGAKAQNIEADLRRNIPMGGSAQPAT